MCFDAVMFIVLLYETIIAYSTGMLFSGANSLKRRKTLLLSSVCALFLPLACFKYLNFLLGAFADVLSLCSLVVKMPKFDLLLPIGISFYTFMAVGYVVDVYQKKIKEEPDVLDFSLFLGFFPQIASGPIGRASMILPQLKTIRSLLYKNFTAGGRMMLWGFFMKLVVGDRAGIYVDTVFGNYSHHNGTSLLLATFMYTIQIYCDFAGYSLIAIGSAKMMGYDLMENFRRPYFAVSVADFWRKWHISLSTWFRDYVYFPCGGSKCSKAKTYRNLMITFLVSGLWHGAAYNFVLWGGYHGICQIIGRALKPMKDKSRYMLHIGDDSALRKVVDICLTFCIVSYGWMMFYAPDMKFIADVTKGYFNLGVPYIHPTTLFFFALGFLILLVKDLKDEFFVNRVCFIEKNNPRLVMCWHYLKFSILAIIIVWIGVLGGGQFIYFKF
jgi:D-alanyl-lipoteichoic acid acyltransferase DltB (MBOAT superfamily)